MKDSGITKIIDSLCNVTVHQLPLTRIRLFVARILYVLVHCILGTDKHLIQRQGVSYEVDLSEGIDLSLFLFGNYQNYITNNKLFSLAKNAVIFDIGANFGSMALKFAQLAPNGRVFAFEPTSYAFDKFRRNLSLNPELAGIIKPIQVFVSDQTSAQPQIKAYSSWKVDGSAVDKHPLHGGTIKSTEFVPAITIDDFCFQYEIQKVDLIKIDTDGHELQVLRGARKTLERYYPILIFEIGLYVLRQQKVSFELYYDFLSSLGYRMFNSKNGREIMLENYPTQIPSRSTTDIVAIPKMDCS